MTEVAVQEVLEGDGWEEDVPQTDSAYQLAGGAMHGKDGGLNVDGAASDGQAAAATAAPIKLAIVGLPNAVSTVAWFV
jgi:hypothetical protein